MDCMGSRSFPRFPKTPAGSAALFLALVVSATNVQAQTATVTGRVTDAANGQPVSGVEIRLFDPGGALLFAASSTSTGQYTVANVTPGTYYLKTHNGVGYAEKTRDGFPCVGVCDLVAPLTLSAGQTFQQDFALDRGAVISGRVLSAVTRQPLAFISSVILYSADRRYIAFADARDGAPYVFNAQATIGGGIAAGTYYLFADATGFAPQAYNGIDCPVSRCLAGATPVRVAAGQTLSGIDFVLQPGGSIAGRVTDAATGAPLQARVDARGSTTEGTQSGLDGRFVVFVDPGAYTVSVQTTDRVAQVFQGIDVPRCSEGRASCTSEVLAGTPVTVAPGQSVTGVDFALRNGGAISGRITRAGQIVRERVVVYDPAGMELGSAFADAAGTYTVAGLVTGRYFARAGTSLYASPPCPLGCAVTAGTPIAVTDGATTTGIDFDLVPPATKLSGTVTSISTGAPVPGATVDLVLGDVVQSQGTTASDGTYAFSPAPGAYRIRVSAAGFLAEWYDNACAVCGNRGTAIPLASGASVSGIDFQLEPAGKITGRLTLATSSRSSIGQFVEALRADGSRVAFVRPSAGVYTIDGLPTGSYFVRAGTNLTSGPGGFPAVGEYATKLWVDVSCDGDTCPLSGATAVNVAAGTTVSNIDFVLEPAGFIEGSILADGSPTDVTVVELFAADGRPAGRAQSLALLGVTSGPGPYSFTGLTAGTYFVRATVPVGTPGATGIAYATTLYRNLACPSCPPQDGTPVTIAAGERRSHVDISLAPAGSIAGVVRDDAGGAPLTSITLTVYTDTGTVAATALTTSRGTYVLNGLAAGRYFVATSNTDAYADEVFADVVCGTCDPLRGRPVEVHGGAVTSGIDFGLARGVLLSGRVTSAGAGVGSVPVTFVNGAGTPVARATSNALGEYVALVPAGTAYGKAGPVSGAGARLYSDVPCPGGTCDPTKGTAISGTAGQRIMAIDFVLPSCGGVQVLPATLPAGTLGTTYSAAMSASGAGPYTYAVQSGALPPGLSLTAGGTVTGTPSTSGRYAFVATAADPAGCGTSKSYTLDVHTCKPTLVTPADGTFDVTAAAAIVQQAYSGSCAATPFASASWIQVGAGSANGVVQLLVAANTGARRSGTVSLGGRTITVNQAAPASAAPFGSFDTPADGAIVAGSVAVTGWSMDDVRVKKVELYRAPVSGESSGPVFIGLATLVPGARPDIERLFPEFPYPSRAGWGYLLLTNQLPNQGNGTFAITAIAEDVEGNRTTLGTRTIVGNNAASVEPFGAIDTPGQGEIIAGPAYINFGWALTPKPKTIPKNGSTIRVVIDGTPVGTVTYDNFRQDVAALFPGLNNTSGAIGYRAINTTALADGLHTISWVALDDAAASTGIGSRYFTVANGSAQFVSGVLTPPALQLAPAGALTRRVDVRELEPIEVALGDAAFASCRVEIRGVERVGAAQRPLPVGSTLDRDAGVFRWLPGPGFVGTYQLSFDVGQCDGSVTRVDVEVTIR